MAIFDAEKRPRGLRMPSLSAMKGGSAASKSQFTLHSMHSMHSKKFEELTANDLPAIPPPHAAATIYPSPPPPRPPPPPSKELPPTPGEQPLPAAPPPLPAKSMSPPTPPSKTPTTGLRSANAPARKPPAAGNAFAIEQAAAARSPPPRPTRATDRPTLESSPPLQPQSVTLSPSTSEQSSQPAKPTSAGPLCSGSITTLEDFNLSPAAMGMGDPFDRTSSDEQDPVPDTPPVEVEIQPAPLKPVHFFCFQEHRAMPVSQNVWHPVPCMACQKRDTEIRHRCVFCDLRICQGCYKKLVQSRQRSLQEMMGSLR
ncbi:hypothetical protein N7510_005808 [Penicillium lagena]|uniref:uncharacterized protein n=1 Tax=Penicillium lagena TaxID=94218 RepID=UPI002540BC4E|nr:uncharacterized protein N7510_005808 [Penicillium lagena]KAJ5612614.1 hypothetical protein N7510_005808 [Penicillium lagena]